MSIVKLNALTFHLEYSKLYCINEERIDSLDSRLNLYVRWFTSNRIKYTNLLLEYCPAVDVWPDFKIPAKFRQKAFRSRFRITSPNVRTSRIWNKFCVYLTHHWTCRTIVIDICSNHFIQYWMQSRKKNSRLLFFFFGLGRPGKSDNVWYLVHFYDCSFYFFDLGQKSSHLLFYYFDFTRYYYFSFVRIQGNGGGDLSKKNQFTFGGDAHPSCPSFVFVERVLIGLVATLFEFVLRARRKYEIS